MEVCVVPQRAGLGLVPFVVHTHVPLGEKLPNLIVILRFGLLFK